MISIFKKSRYALIGVLITACHPQLAPLNTSESIVIDGEDTEWNRDQYQKVSGLGLVYSIAQEEQYIKILVKAMDQQTFKKIGLLGLTIWLDGTGKSKKEVGIKYPLGAMESGMLENMMSQRGSLQNFDREKLEGKGLEMLEEKSSNEVGLIGILDDTKELYHVTLEQLKIPIEISQKIVSRQEFIIEYSVPNSLLKKGKKDFIAIGFEIEGINVQELIKKQMAGRGGGRFAGVAGGRMTGRSMGMGGMNDKLRAFQELNQPVMTWSKFQWNE
ncbi:MAG: hypothetical protein ABJH98_07890 [Reichenbachiella sp.]|uniref:hypothetical protein n=1 Tax=Reichenbachiella sp. TaxID=2184521 RepID=UPI00329A6EF7